MLLHENAGRAGVVEVDVGEEKMAEVGERDAALRSPAFKCSTHVVGPQSRRAGPSSVSSR